MNGKNKHSCKHSKYSRKITRSKVKNKLVQWEKVDIHPLMGCPWDHLQEEDPPLLSQDPQILLLSPRTIKRANNCGKNCEIWRRISKQGRRDPDAGCLVVFSRVSRACSERYASAAGRCFVKSLFWFCVSADVTSARCCLIDDAVGCFILENHITKRYGASHQKQGKTVLCAYMYRTLSRWRPYHFHTLHVQVYVHLRIFKLFNYINVRFLHEKTEKQNHSCDKNFGCPIERIRYFWE